MRNNFYSIKSFTPLEKATDFNQELSPFKANGGLMPPSAQTARSVRKEFSNRVKELNFLTGFTLRNPYFAIRLADRHKARLSYNRKDNFRIV